jgi:hypothetical protein
MPAPVLPLQMLQVWLGRMDPGSRSRLEARLPVPKPTLLARAKALLIGTLDRYVPAHRPGLRRLLLAYAVLQLAGIAWDLPCSFEWENDGVAPRDLFAGVVLNLPGGSGHTYPLLHNLLLMVLALPVLVVVACTTPGWTFDLVRDHLLGYGFMTAVALIAKLVSVTMGCLAIAALARVAERISSPKAGLWTAAFAATNLTVAYYGRTQNLDGPYLCWMALAADHLLDVLQDENPQADRGFAWLVAASVATKDQAYAAWILPGVWLAVRLPIRRTLRIVGTFLLGLGVLGGAFLNPLAFWHRVQTMIGPASQDWRSFPATLPGLLGNLRQLALDVPEVWWPLPVVALLLLGILLTWRQVASPARWLPLALAVSHLAFFTLAVGRTGHRFVLPTGFWLAAYVGMGATFLWDRAPPWQVPARAIALLLVAVSLRHSLAVEVTQWSDARRDLEARLARLPAGTRVEVYGPTFVQPRWGLGALAGLRVERVGFEPALRRNPIPGVREVRAPLADLEVRRPDVVVVASAVVEPYLPRDLRPGEIVTRVATRQKEQDGTVALFTRLAQQDLAGYRVQRFAATLPAWATALGMRPTRVHGSTGEAWLLFERL